MNLRKGLKRLAIVLSVLFIFLGFLTAEWTDYKFVPDIGVISGIFVWLLYWVSLGFIEKMDKVNSRNSNPNSFRTKLDILHGMKRIALFLSIIAFIFGGIGAYSFCEEMLWSAECILVPIENTRFAGT